MIKYRLGCPSGHEFESWFPKIEGFEDQSRRGLLACPVCGSVDIAKLPMAPAVVSRRSSEVRRVGQTLPNPDAPPLADRLKALRRTLIENSENVGPRFADEARKIHSGNCEERQIHGSSTPEEARDLIEDGIPFGVLPPLPEDLN